MTKRDKVTIDDIIGIVHTDEPTNSVEEVRNLRGRENRTEKRFNLWDIEGTAFIEDHKEGSYHIGKTEDVDINSLRNITKRLNIYAEENEMLKSENETYQNMFFEIIETALTDKNCRELYCKGILDIFDKANSLNQAREMIKVFLND